MKKYLCFLLALVFCLSLLPLGALASEDPAADGDTAGVAIDGTNFPDETFRAYVGENFDKDGDGFLSDVECADVRGIEIQVDPITSLAGIEYFPNLESLNAWSEAWELVSPLSELDLSHNTKLKDLTLGYCAITSLDVSMLPDLESLFTGYTKLTYLDLSHNPALRQLICNDSALTGIDLTGCSQLAIVDCCGNEDLKTLDISSCPLLIADVQDGWRQMPESMSFLPTYDIIRVCGHDPDPNAFRDYTFAVNTFTEVITGEEPEQEGLVLEVTSQAELTDALDRTEPVAEIRVTKDFTVTEESLVLYDEAHYPNYRETSLIIEQGVTLTIGDGGAIGMQAPSFWDWTGGLSDDEKPAQPSGRMINDGTIIAKQGSDAGFSFEENNGEVIVEAGGDFRIPETNNGAVTVKRGGALRTSQGNDCHNNGEIMVEQGAELEVRMGSNLANHGRLTVDGIFRFGCFGDEAWFDPADGKTDGCGYLAAVDVLSPDAPGDGVKALASQLGETMMDGTDLRVGYVVNAADYDALAAAFPASGEEENGNRYVIACVVEDLTVTGELGALGSVIVPAGVTVTIADGAELGTGLYSAGTIVVEAGGTLATTMGGNNALVSDGTLIVKEGAELISRMGGSVVNRGDMTLDGTFTCGALNYADETGREADHVWFRNEGTVTGGGTIVLNDMGLKDKEGTVADVQAALGEGSGVTVEVGGGSGEPGDPVAALRAYLRDPEGHFAKGFDTDRDGKLSEDEIIAAVDEFHGSLDAGDAVLLLRCHYPMACAAMLLYLVGIG